MSETFSITVKAKSNTLYIDLKELWLYRELFYILTWKDLKVRYKQTVLGVLWVLLQPLVSTFIFTVFFGKLAKIPSGSLPYSLFVLIGLVFWNLFSGSVSRASGSMIENQNLIKKVYIPRIILPLSAIITVFVDFSIALIMMMVYAIYLGFIPSIHALYIIPIGILIITIASAGLGMFLSGLNVRYRDVRYIVPFFIQTLIFLSPVIYPTKIIRPESRWLLSLNPAAGVIESIRATFSHTQINYQYLGISAISAVGLFIFGLYYFKSTEKFFADII